MRAVAFLCVFFTAFVCFADAPVAIKNVTVIDATGAPAAPGRTVIFRNGIIDEIGVSGKVKVPADANVIDGSGKYLIPGLWDMHIHTALVANPDWTRKVCLPLLAANGIAGIRDMGGDFDVIRQVRKEIEAGELTGPNRCVRTDARRPRRSVSAGHPVGK